MATYILLLTLTPAGRENMLEDPQNVLRAVSSINIPSLQNLGLYAVLGEYDFVSIIEAPDNEAVARCSLELGVRVGAHITTLPAIPIARLEGATPADPRESIYTGTGPPTLEDLGPAEDDTIRA